MSGKRLTLEEFRVAATVIHGDQYDYSGIEFVRDHGRMKVALVCKKHGKFLKFKRDHLNGEGCPLCNGNKSNLQTFLEKSHTIHGNRYNYSFVDYKNSITRIDIVCPTHGIFQQTPNAHLCGGGCSKCAADARKPDVVGFIERANTIHDGKYDYSQTVLKALHIQIEIICPKHGVFQRIPSNHLDGSGCPFCSRSKIGAPNFEEMAREVHGDKYQYDLKNVVGSASTVSIICPLHGSFLQVAETHLAGRGCRECGFISTGNALRRTHEEFFNKATQVHGTRYDYSKVGYVDNITKIEIICPTHGSFFQTPASHLLGSCCNKCSDTTLGGEQFIVRSMLVHGDKYNYDRIHYVNNYTKVEIYCASHGAFLQSPGDHLKGNGCSKCVRRVSLVETEWLDQMGVPRSVANRQVSIKLNGVHSVADGFIPETLTIYEFWGDWWHGNPEFFKPDEIHPVKKQTFGTLFAKTVDKINRIRSCGYNLIQVWENEFLSGKMTSEDKHENSNNNWCIGTNGLLSGRTPS